MLDSKYGFLERVGLLCLAAAAGAVVIHLLDSQFGAGMIMGMAIWELAER
jgi:hypothetical protein